MIGREANQMRALVLRVCDRADADRLGCGLLVGWLVGGGGAARGSSLVRRISPPCSFTCRPDRGPRQDKKPVVTGVSPPRLAVGFSPVCPARGEAAKRLRDTMSSAKDRNKAKAEVRSVLAMRDALSAFSHARVAVHRRTMRSSGESVSDESSRRRRSWRACGARSSGWIRRGMARSM